MRLPLLRLLQSSKELPLLHPPLQEPVQMRKVSTKLLVVVIVEPTPKLLAHALRSAKTRRTLRSSPTTAFAAMLADPSVASLLVASRRRRRTVKPNKRKRIPPRSRSRLKRSAQRPPRLLRPPPSPSPLLSPNPSPLHSRSTSARESRLVPSPLSSRPKPPEPSRKLRVSRSRTISRRCSLERPK